MSFLRSLFTSSAKKAKEALLAQEREETERLKELVASKDAAREVEVWMSERREARLQEQIDHLLLVADKRAERARYYLGRSQQYRRTAAHSDEDKATMDEVERQEVLGLDMELGSTELNEEQ